MKDRCFLVRQPSINVCYIYLPGCAGHRNCAWRFVMSLKKHHPAIAYRFTVICQGAVFDGKDIFGELGDYEVFHHDDSGWDIGGYLAFAPHCHEEWLYCFGGPSYVRHDGWLDRMAEAANKYGVGIYGTAATYEVRPHLNTSGFMTNPKLLALYPNHVVDKRGRYEFEHGYGAFWMMLSRLNLPAYMVTTQPGEYSWPDWRLPPNIYRRGDQSNLLSYFTHADNYDAASPGMKQGLAHISDTLTDERFVGCRTLPLPYCLMTDRIPSGRLGGF